MKTLSKEVSFELAKLLKEKGFKPTKLFGYISKFYNPNTKTLLAYGRTGKTDLTKAYYAPTIVEVIDWIYKKDGVWINSNPFLIIDGIRFSADIWKDNHKKSVNHFDTPFEAYEKAIEHYLTNIKK